jgi:nitrous oxidase accessory protein NosD
MTTSFALLAMTVSTLKTASSARSRTTTSAFADENGIEVNDSYFILIDENEVADADEAGIFIDPSAVIFVTNNNADHDNDIGLHVQGPNNGYINVTGNTFTDNRVGARFESGIIDLTGISSDPSFGGFGNKFIGGDIGLEFDAWGGRTTQLSLVQYWRHPEQRLHL